MTPQEEQVLVQIIVQCVRAVLETYTATQQFSRGPSESGAFKSSPGSRFIDVAPAQRALKDSSLNGNGNFARVTGSSRDDVREAVQRLLRNSETPTAEGQQAQRQNHQLIRKAEI